MMKNQPLKLMANWACIAAILLAMFMISCEDQDEQNLSENLQEVSYAMSDQYSVTVRLDPNLVHSSYAFKTLDEHDEYLNNLEESSNGVITVNKKMYETLSHYFDPYQIAVIDNNYEIEVEGEVYKVDHEAIYKKVANTWELYLFYGESGKVDLEETAKVHESANNLEMLASYNFKSPVSRRIYERQVLNVNSGKLADRDEIEYPLRNPDGSTKRVQYRKVNNGTIYSAEIRWRCWNESYNKWGKKAKGGTITEIKRMEEGTSAVWRSLSNDAKIGTYLISGMVEGVGGRVTVKVDGGKGSSSASNRWSVSKDKVKREKNKSAKSTHNGEVRDSSTGELEVGMSDIKLN
ncbi:hypothetical protein LVD15_20135 [Fulvivirga maritima]|uniref:hypothetical protein n=1 Tax=Fulvivirga maritima TaxID=2904247 RepID=UPI001F375336|nr:hypothetical protein [Fulvivirga maritima]UII25593.1 hypothetical protein LVD15_20135 [Fulvivirga maritima]